VANRRIDNTAPTAGITDPGSPLSGTVTLNATGTDGGSGVLNVKIQRSPTGAGTWTDICTDPTSPYSCAWDTTTVGDGGYDLRAVTTDNAGNVTYSSVVANRVVDNAGPSAVDIQTTNGGATAGRPETNDTVTFTYSEQLLPSSVLFGWDGSATPVTLRMNNSGNNDQLEVWNALNTARLPLTNTFVSLNGNFIQTSATFAATMVQSGASITITLGLQTGGTVRTETSNVTLSWPSSATPTDLAGNACSGNTVAESGAADRDF
jgi:chitinase